LEVKAGGDNIVTYPSALEVAENDYVYGTYVLGATVDLLAQHRQALRNSRRSGFVFKKTPNGRLYTSLVTARAPRNSRASIANGRDVARRAQALGARFKASLNKVAIHGLVTPPRSGTKPRYTVAQLKKMSDDLAKTGRELERLVEKHEKRIDAKDASLASRQAKVKAALAKVRHTSLTLPPKAKPAAGAVKAPSRTAALTSAVRLTGDYDVQVLGPDFQILGPHDDDQILGPDFQILGAEDHVEVLGEAAIAEILGAPTDPDPTRPGYLIDGSPDPSYAEGGGEPASDGSTDSYASEGPPSYGMGPAPTKAPDLVEGTDYVKDPYFVAANNETTPFSSVKEVDVGVPTQPVPLGAVYFENQKPLPWQGVGSRTRFTRDAPADVTARENFAVASGGLARNGGWGASGFQLGGGNQSIMDGWYLYWEGNQASAPDLRYKRDGQGGGIGGNYSQSMAERVKRSMAFGWGPLVGNPGGDWTKNLHYDVGADKWFWYRNNAPDWATTADNAERLEKALLDWKTEWTRRKTEYDTQQVNDRLEAQEQERLAKEQAKYDADMERQRERDDAEAARQATLAEQQQGQFEQQYAQQEAQLELDQQRAMLEYMRAHPDEAYPAQAAEEGGDDEGIDWGQPREEGFSEGGEEATEADLLEDVEE
jgi:hypothetical protein